MRTELQYNLQKARALATSLRCTLEAIADLEFDWYEVDEEAASPEHELDTMIEEVGMAEGFLDELPEDFIGEGSVKLEIEEFTS